MDKRAVLAFFERMRRKARQDKVPVKVEVTIKLFNDNQEMREERRVILICGEDCFYGSADIITVAWYFDNDIHRHSFCEDCRFIKYLRMID